jgi:hypothetical protein
MDRLKLWMRLVGGFFILIGLFNTPPVIAARMNSHYPTLGLDPGHVALAIITDLWFLFGLETAVIGLMLIVGSASPLRNKLLVQTVLLLELTRGVLTDIYWITRGYSESVFYIGFIVIHLVIIVTGWYALRRAETHARKASPEANYQSALRRP